MRGTALLKIISRELGLWPSATQLLRNHKIIYRVRKKIQHQTVNIIINTYQEISRKAMMFKKKVV